MFVVLFGIISAIGMAIAGVYYLIEALIWML